MADGIFAENLARFLYGLAVEPVYVTEDGEGYTRYAAENGGWNLVNPVYQVFETVARSVPANPADSYRQISAGDKGRKLLWSLLNGEQKHQLGTEGWFLVTGSRNGLYQIRCTTRVYNVTRLHRRTGKKMYKLCAGPAGVTPNDFWLAQKLMIEADEKTFLRIANKSD